MPRYDHLPLQRIEGELPRRKFGGGRAPPRDAKPHGAAIQKNLDTVIAAHKRRPTIADIDPALILKIRTAGPISEDEWAKLKLTVLASDPDKTLILFADDNELQEFKRRLIAYRRDPPAGQKHPEYAGFVGAIEDVGELTPADRIGPTLRAEGLKNPNDFKDSDIQIIDIELWQPSQDKAQIFTYRVARRLDELGGTLINEYRGNAATLMRIEGNGQVIRGILDLPEIAAIDRPPVPDLLEIAFLDLTIDDIGAVEAPSVDAPTIGIIDSGITAAHPLLQPAVTASFGIPQTLGDDDQKGHGTPVSGIAVYGDLRQRLTDDALEATFKIASAKVVDQHGLFDKKELVPQQMESAIRRMHDEFGCRVINISLGDKLRPVASKPSAWAAVLDDLARELDLVIVVSASNSDSMLLEKHGDDIVRAYPFYLLDSDNHILEPGSAINALTVGAIAHANGLTADDADLVGVRPIAQAGQPSPFTRVGPGVRRMIKPDLVDFGGTAVFDGATQSVVAAGRRSAAGLLTLYHLYLDHLFTSVSGTSFASPLVAYKAALIREALPDCSANLVRALLALSAQHPQPALACLNGLDKEDVHHILGYGVADVDHATASEDNRVILYREDVLPVDRFAVFEVPIPQLFQTEKGTRHIRVALAFDPPVRHTRFDYAGLSMGFHLLRGTTQGDVFNAFRKWEMAEGDAFKLAARLKCSLDPGPQMRERGTLQCGTFSTRRDISNYGDRYFLAVRCEGGWASNLVENQRFAVAVELRHEAEIELYQRVAERVQIRV
jgi:hypothetical protein